MASFTQNVAEQFPAGTTVGAFKQSNWPFGSLPPLGAPLGSADTSAVVAADGTLALTLTDGVAYFLTNTSGTPGQRGYVRVFDPAGAVVVVGGSSSPFASLGWVSAKDAPFNAKGDGKQVADAAISSTVNPTKLSSATAAFTSADVGKVVLVNGAGVAAAPLVSTILSVAGGVATLADAASTTVSAQVAYFGTDDTAAIQAAIDSLITTDPATRGGTVFLPAGIYLCNGPYKAAATASFGGDTSGLIYRAQLAVPAVINDAPPLIRLLGEMPLYRTNTQVKAIGSSRIRFQHGTQLVSTRVDGDFNTTTGWACFIGGPDIYKTQTQPALGDGNGFTAAHLAIENLDIRTPDNPTLCAINAQLCTSFTIEKSVVAVTQQGGFTTPSHPSGQAIVCPAVDNDDAIYIRDVLVRNYYCGVTPGEHTRIDNLVIFSNICHFGTQTQIYPWTAGHIQSSGQQYGIAQVDPGGSGPVVNSKRVYCDVQMWQIEDHTTGALQTIAHLFDGGGIIGRFQYHRKTANWIVSGSAPHVRWRNIVFDPSGATAGGGVMQEIQPPAAGAKIDFRAASGGSWASMPLAVTELGGSTSVRAWIDLSLYTQARIVANVSTVGTAGAVFAVQYSTDSGSTWNYLDGASGPSVSIAALGTVKSGYVALAAGALAEVLVRCVGSGGNGATSPGFGLVYVEFKP